MKITLKRSLMAVLCVVGMSSFVACSDSDEPIVPPVVPPTTENGSSAGNMTYVLEDSVDVSAPEAVTYDANQSSVGIDNIYFAEFPIKGLVTSVSNSMGITDEAAIEGLIKSIGKVKYEINYTAKENSDKTEMDLTLTANPLKLNVTNVGEIVVTVEVGTAKYVNATKVMTFTLKAKSVTVAGSALEAFKPIILTFEATKK